MNPYLRALQNLGPQARRRLLDRVEEVALKLQDRGKTKFSQAARDRMEGRRAVIEQRTEGRR